MATLRLCLKDSPRHIQERLNDLTDEAPSNVCFALEAKTLQDGLEEQIACANAIGEALE